MGKTKHPIQHVEWRTRDAARLQAFYGSVYDWTFGEAGPGYTIIQSLGGIAQVNDGDPMPTGVSAYVTVENLAPHEEKIVAGGGKVLLSHHTIGDMGTISVFTDPDGNLMGMWMPAAKPAKQKKAKKAAKKEKKAAKKAAKKEKKKEKKK